MLQPCTSAQPVCYLPMKRLPMPRDLRWLKAEWIALLYESK